MPSPIDPDTRNAILADITSDEDLSCRAIADRHGVSPSTVSKLAKDHGHANAFERAQTKSATEAAVADNKARRAVEATESLMVAAGLRGKILTAAHGRDAQGWATAYGIMADKHVMFDQHDADNGSGDTKSLLAGIGEAFKAAAASFDEPPSADAAPLP